MGLLDGSLSKSIYAGFRGKLLAGVIRQAGTPTGTALDDHGDPETTVPTDTAIEGFTEAYSAFTRAQAGIPATDLKLNIFAASCPGVTPMIGNQARLDKRMAGRITSRWYQVRGPIDIDSADVLWVCQAFEIKAPTDGG